MYIPLTPSEETALIGFSVHQVITYLTKVFPSLTLHINFFFLLLFLQFHQWSEATL